jgi:hypothetical protein
LLREEGKTSGASAWYVTPLEIPSKDVCSLFDIFSDQITLWRMTLLQTRVDDKVAVRFKKTARQRGITPYEYLQQIIADAAQASEQNTWDTHWQRVAALKLKPANKTLAQVREEDGDR